LRESEKGIPNAYRTLFIIAAATILGVTVSPVTHWRFAVARAPVAFMLELAVIGALLSAASIAAAPIVAASVAVASMAHVAVTVPAWRRVGAAAVGAAAGAAAVGPYYNSACGSYPYPPCQ
jgi:hypothetical protein